MLGIDHRGWGKGRCSKTASKSTRWYSMLCKKFMDKKIQPSIPADQMEAKLQSLFSAMEKRKEELAKEKEDRKLLELQREKSLWWNR